MRFSFSEYTKIDVSWGFPPDPTGGAYCTPPDPLAGFKGATLRQMRNGGRRGKTGGGGKREERGNGEGRGKGGSWGVNSVLFVGGDRRPWLY